MERRPEGLQCRGTHLRAYRWQCPHAEAPRLQQDLEKTTLEQRQWNSSLFVLAVSQIHSFQVDQSKGLSRPTRPLPPETVALPPRLVGFHRHPRRQFDPRGYSPRFDLDHFHCRCCRYRFHRKQRSICCPRRSSLEVEGSFHCCWWWFRRALAFQKARLSASFRRALAFQKACLSASFRRLHPCPCSLCKTIGEDVRRTTARRSQSLSHHLTTCEPHQST